MQIIPWIVGILVVLQVALTLKVSSIFNEVEERTYRLRIMQEQYETYFDEQSSDLKKELFEQQKKIASIETTVADLLNRIQNLKANEKQK